MGRGSGLRGSAAAPERPADREGHVIGALITIDPADAGAIAAASARAADCLAAGGVAVLPAEGLYGLHAGAGVPAGVARLRALKQDDRRRPYILLVADGAAAQALLDVAAPAARAALEWMARAWPAPVTFVVPAAARVPVELAPEGRVALRCPGSALLRATSALLAGPLLSTSANASGARPPAGVDEIPAPLRDACDLVVDAGSLAGVGSTVARVEADGRLTLLRAGAWSPPGGAYSGGSAPM